MSAIATTPTLELDAPQSLDDRLARYFKRIVRDAEDEVFEDGMESNFSKGLASAIEEYGDAALTAIETIILNTNTNIEVQGETLTQLGAIDNPSTHHRRLAILTSALESQDVRIRDAASLGIETLEDESAIPAMEAALHREPSVKMRDNLTAVINQLRAPA